MKRSLLVCIFTMAACSAKLSGGDTGTAGTPGGGGGGSGGDEGSDGDDGNGGGGNPDDLPDPRTNAAFDPNCADVDGTPVPGATSFFYGQFGATSDPTVWEGYEEWILYANDAWRAVGVDDCTITWNATAAQTDEAGTCADCAYGLTVAATIDLARTSCPEGLYEGAENFEVVYGVRVTGDRSAYVYAQNGNPLGEGYAAEGASNYLSAGSCVWF